MGAATYESFTRATHKARRYLLISFSAVPLATLRAGRGPGIGAAAAAAAIFAKRIPALSLAMAACASPANIASMISNLLLFTPAPPVSANQPAPTMLYGRGLGCAIGCVACIVHPPFAAIEQPVILLPSALLQ